MENRNINVTEDRLYFTIDEPEAGLVEYDLALLSEFIAAGMAEEYKPRIIFDSQVVDFEVETTKKVSVLTPDGTVKQLKSLLGNLHFHKEIKLQEEAYPELAFTKICRIRTLLVTAAHDQATNFVVFHLIDQNFDQVSAAWVLSDSSDEEATTTDESLRSAHIHSMQAVRLHNADYILAGSYTSGLHLLALINNSLHLLLHSQPLAPSGLSVIRGISALLPAPGRLAATWAVWGELLSADGDSSAFLRRVHLLH